jgi:tripartite-type tricarboxylate transporter receptor subunit TctC
VKRKEAGMIPVKLTRRGLLAALVATAPAAALAQGSYPTRTIRIVVPLPPGPFADALPRIIADKLAARWGQPVIVENRPGMAQNLGAEAVAKAEPDGYTLLATPAGPLVLSQHFYPKLGFDPAAFVPVTVMAALPYTLVVHPKVPAATLAELVAFAKANPDKLTHASPGTGSPLHLVGEMLRSAAGIRWVHAPYKGTAPATTDLIAGHVDLMIDNLANTLPLIRSGQLRALAVANATRIAELPDVPAIAESYPGLVASGWYAIAAPPKTPPEIAGKLASAIAETLRLPDVARKLADYAATPVGSAPEETAAFFRQESERWRAVIVANGIKPE